MIVDLVEDIRDSLQRRWVLESESARRGIDPEWSFLSHPGKHGQVTALTGLARLNHTDSTLVSRLEKAAVGLKQGDWSAMVTP